MVFIKQKIVIAIAMTPLPKLGELLDLEFLKSLHDQKIWFTERDDN
jgi:hypothetical protein